MLSSDEEEDKDNNNNPIIWKDAYVKRVSSHSGLICDTRGAPPSYANS